MRFSRLFSVVAVGVGLVVLSGPLSGVAQPGKAAGAPSTATVPVGSDGVGVGSSGKVVDGLLETVKPGESVVSEGVDGSIVVRRADGKVEKRVGLGGSVGVPKDVVAGAGDRAGFVETKVGSVTVSLATDVVAGGVVAELLGADGVGLSVGTPELVVKVVPVMDVGVGVAKKPKRSGGSDRTVKPVGVKKARVEAKGVDVDGVFGAGTGLSLMVTSSGVKEVIRLGERPVEGEVVQFRSKVDLRGVKARVLGGGPVEFVDGAGKVAFSAPQGVAWDSSSTDRDKRSTSGVSVLLDGDTLVMVPDQGWLADPATVFPVFIDPTINVEATRRVYVEANNPNYSFLSSPQFINGGFAGNTVRTFERLDVSQYGAAASAVNQAVLHSRVQFCEPDFQAPVKFSKVVSGWGGLEGNAVVNGGFEQPGSSPSGAAGWVSRWQSGTATRNTGSVLGVGGEYGLRMVNGVGGVGWMAVGSEPFAVTGGEPLTVKADLRHANGGYWGVVRVEYYAGVPAAGWGQMTDNVMAAITDPIWSNTNGAQSGSVTVPAGMKWGRITIHHNGPALDVDNVKVLRDANSLVANPGFSAGQGGWSLRTGAGNFGFDGWHGWMNSNGGWNAMVSSPVAVVPGEVLTGSADVYSTGGGTTVIRVEYYSGVPAGGWDQFTDSVSLNVHTGVTSDALPWRTVGGLTTVPAGMVWARLSVHHSGPGTTIAVEAARISRPNPDADQTVTTWNTQPSIENALPKTVTGSSQLTPLDVEITDWVKGWITNPATNFGIRIDMEGSGKRCSLAGGWVSIVYNEVPFEPTQPATANTFVNGGFESGGYQWGACVNPANVAITVEYMYQGSSESGGSAGLAVSGQRFGKVVAQNGSSFACQRAVYRANGQGNTRVTVTAKLKSRQLGVQSLFIIDQQGNPAQGAQFAQRQVATTLNANGWQTVTLSMCEASAANQTVSVYIGSQTPGAAVYVDDVAMTMGPDPAGCAPPPPTTLPPVGQQPDGAHYFEDGVPTPLEWGVDASACMVLNAANQAVLTADPNADCLMVTPKLGPGWVLETGGGCLGRDPASQRFALVPCLRSDAFFNDNVLFTDQPGQVGLAFPIRLIGSGGVPNNLCVSADSSSAPVVFAICVSGDARQLWFDSPRAQGPINPGLVDVFMDFVGNNSDLGFRAATATEVYAVAAAVGQGVRERQITGQSPEYGGWMIVDEGGFVAPLNLMNLDSLNSDPADFQWINLNGNAIRVDSNGTPGVSPFPVSTIKQDWVYLTSVSLAWLTISETQQQQIEQRHGTTRQQAVESHFYEKQLSVVWAVDEQAAQAAIFGAALFTAGARKLRIPAGPPPRLTVRLTRDILYANKFPTPPLAKSGFTKAIGRLTHQAELSADLLRLQNRNPTLVGPGVIRIEDIRVNQTQVNAGLVRVGRNRPDLSWTAVYANNSRKRFHIEYEGNPPVRGQYHTDRITLNDPGSVVLVKVIP